MARILLVDDSRFQRKAVSKILTDLGHEVAEAENGEVGLNSVESVKPDLIITDLLMPVLDGLGLLRGLKIRGYNTPVVVLSADIQVTTQQECLQLGARAFMPKPVTEAKVQSVLTELFGSARTEKTKC